MRKHRRRNKKQRNIIIISACSLLLIMTVGYAAMSTNLEINAKGNVLKNASLGEDLVENVGTVTNGDGLYKDAYEENVYTYRGSNPNNYVNFNNELWRIISVNTNDNTIKIIRNESIGSFVYDSVMRRYNKDGYCSDGSYGCNIFGSNTTLYDKNMSPITTLAREYGKTAYNLPSEDSELNIYLNNDYYNNLSLNAQEMIIEGIYKVGPVGSPPLNTQIEEAGAAKWKGKIAMADITEYARASIYSSCTGFSTPLAANCANQNWMHNYNLLWLTISPIANNASALFRVNASEFQIGSVATANTNQNIRPVVTLSPEVQITSGDGTQNNAYNLELK